MLLHKLEAELKCPACHQRFQIPLLLPCGHSLCCACADRLFLASLHADCAGTGSPRSSAAEEARSAAFQTARAGHSVANCVANSTAKPNCPTSNSLPSPGVGKTNQVTSAPHSTHSGSEDAVSEADSGVVVMSCCHGETLAVSPVVRSSGSDCLLPGCQASSGVICSLVCPVCQCPVPLPAASKCASLSEWLPRNRALERLASRVLIDVDAAGHEDVESPLGRFCQLCETDGDGDGDADAEPTEAETDTEVEASGHALSGQATGHGNRTTRGSPPARRLAGSGPCLAVAFCEQCEVRYCSVCLARWHPARGP
ncbi:unnamed protein product, partial [Protopolystoma xenopodis]